LTAKNAVYSVSELNREAKRLLAQHFLTVSVQGEISNFSVPASGHWYFTLKDAQAQVRCAMFRGQQNRFTSIPRNGDLVVVNAQVSLYEPRGDYQLVVEQLEQAGDGALRLAFEKLKAKLYAEGLFDETRKQTLPLIPRTIGIVTSPSGAAVHDILTVLKRRFPAVPVILYPAAVQGEAGKGEICRALQLANQRMETDVLIVARGGGSLEDLWSFNEESVARAIAASKIPVIAGIGHEVDVTIADLVADLRAATPSAAAEHAVPHQQEWLNGFLYMEQQLVQRWQRRLQQLILQLSWLNKALKVQHPGEKLQRNAQRLDELEQRLTLAMQNCTSYRSRQFALTRLSFYRQRPTRYIMFLKQQLQNIEGRLQQRVAFKLATLTQILGGTSQTLNAVSPLATLERGYAIVRNAQDEIVKCAGELAESDLITTRFADGSVVSEVKKIQR